MILLRVYSVEANRPRVSMILELDLMAMVTGASRPCSDTTMTATCTWNCTWCRRTSGRSSWKRRKRRRNLRATLGVKDEKQLRYNMVLVVWRLALQYLGGVTARVQLFLLLDQPNCHMKGPFQPKSSSYILQTRPSFVSKGEDTNLPD